MTSVASKRWPPFSQCRDRDGEKRSRRAHKQNVARTDTLVADRLQYGGDPTDQQRSKDGPQQVGILAPRGPHNNCGRNDNATHEEQSILPRQTYCQRWGWVLVRLVTHIAHRISHCSSPALSFTGSF